MRIPRSALEGIPESFGREHAIASAILAVDRRTEFEPRDIAAAGLADFLPEMVEMMALSCPQAARRFALWGADCVARVAVHEPDHGDGQSPVRAAVRTVRRFARGEVGPEALRAAQAAVDAANRTWFRKSFRTDLSPIEVERAHASLETAQGFLSPSSRGLPVDSEEAAIGALNTIQADRRGMNAAEPGNVAAARREDAWQTERLLAWLSEPEPADEPLPD